MLPYVICFSVGGVFVLLSVWGGLDGVDIFDVDTADVDLDADADADAAIDGEVDDIDVGTYAFTSHQPRRILTLPRRRWIPLLSFRFWTFGLCFFGLTGLLLTWLQSGLSAVGVAAIATIMGLLCGSLAAWVLRLLGKRQVNSMTSPDSLIGLMGTVEIPFDANSRGKVRLSIKGTTIGFSALTQDNKTFQPGDQVLVVGLEHNKLWVVSSEALTSSEWEGAQ